MHEHQKVLRKTTRKEFLFKAPDEGLPGSSPRMVSPNRASFESSISSSETEVAHSTALAVAPVLSDAAAAAPALSEALRFVLELRPGEAQRGLHLSHSKKEFREKVEALRKHYDTAKKLAKLDEVSSSKHLQSDGYTEAQAGELQDALTSQVTVFTRFRSFATLNDLLTLVLANQPLPLEQLCDQLRAFRSGSRTGLPALCEELSELTAAKGRLEKYAYLSDLADAVLDMKLGATKPEKQAERNRLRAVFAKAAAARNAESSHSGERSQPRDRAEKGVEKSSPTKKPRNELNKGQSDGSSFEADERKRGGAFPGSQVGSDAVGQDDYRAKAHTSSSVLSSEAGRPSAKKGSATLFGLVQASADSAKSPYMDDATRERRRSQRSLRSPDAGDVSKAQKRLSQREQRVRPSGGPVLSGSGSATPKNAGSNSASPTSSQVQPDRISKLKAADSESSSSMSSSRPNFAPSSSRLKVQTEAEWAKPLKDELALFADNFSLLYQQEALESLRAVLKKLGTTRPFSRTSVLEAARSLEKDARDYLGLVCEAEKSGRSMPAKLSLFMIQIFQAIRSLQEEERRASMEQETAAPGTGESGDLTSPEHNE